MDSDGVAKSQISELNPGPLSYSLRGVLLLTDLHSGALYLQSIPSNQLPSHSHYSILRNGSNITESLLTLSAQRYVFESAPPAVRGCRSFKRRRLITVIRTSED